MDWRLLGACVDKDPDLFFPRRGQNSQPAKDICAGCAVKITCLNYALDNNEKWGVWGGTSEKQRRVLRRNRVRPVRLPAPVRHGTSAGYALHKRRGEDACEECRRAHAVYKLERKRLRVVA